MGVYNYLNDVQVPCLACGRVSRMRIQFKAGPCYMYDYKLGDTLDWTRSGTVHAPEIRGRERAEIEATLCPCADCVKGQIRDYQSVRSVLEKEGRLEFNMTRRDDVEGSPDPTADMYIYVDGIYGAATWIELELRRLGARLSRPYEMADGVLVIEKDVLAAVLPSTAEPRGRGFHPAQLLQECDRQRSTSALLLSLPAYQNPQGRSELMSQEAALCRAIELAPRDPRLLEWLGANAKGVLATTEPELPHWRLLAATLNAMLAAGPEAMGPHLDAASSRPGGDFTRSLLESARVALDARKGGDPSARIVMSCAPDPDPSSEFITLSCHVQPRPDLPAIPSTG